MGRWKKIPRLQAQILRKLNETQEGKRFEELFRELKPGSKSTYSDMLDALVAAGLIDFHYLTRTFRISERGREIIRPLSHNLEAMDLLVESGIFGDRKDAVQAAIEFCLGNYAQFRGVNIGLIMPLQLDAKGNMIGVPSNSNEWEKKERELGLLRKVSHDAEEELVSELELFCEKYPTLNSDQFGGLQAWPREVAGALILLFYSDRSMALNSLPILREFLRKYKTFKPDKLNENLLTRIHKPQKSGRRQ